MGHLLELVDQYREFVSKYGELSEVTLEVAKASDLNHVWTMWSRGSDFLANELAEDPEVFCYFVSAQPWSEPIGAITVVITEWVDCPTCEANGDEDDWDQDDCEECEGAGVLSITIPGCLDAKTDEEVFSRRQA